MTVQRSASEPDWGRTNYLAQPGRMIVGIALGRRNGQTGVGYAETLCAPQPANSFS